MNSNTSNTTQVGVGVMILKDGKVLMAKRKGSHGAGEFAFPGGHLEYMENYEECAIRETREETGIEIKNIRFLYTTILKRYAPKHYVQIGMIADWASGEPQLMEPDKSEEWNWYDINQLPIGSEMEFVSMYINAYKSNINYYKEF